MARKRDAILVAGAAALAARGRSKDFSSGVMSRVASASLRRGMRSGSQGWLYVAAAAGGLRILHKYTGRKEEVFSIKLHPGEALEIREIRRAR